MSFANHSQMSPVTCPLSCQMSPVKYPLQFSYPTQIPTQTLSAPTQIPTQSSLRPHSNSHSNLTPPPLIYTAQHMKSKRFMKGEILYCKGELVENIYLVVSGEYLLDVEDLTGTRKQHPFLNSNQDNCYHMSGGWMTEDGSIMLLICDTPINDLMTYLVTYTHTLSNTLSLSTLFNTPTSTHPLQHTLSLHPLQHTHFNTPSSTHPLTPPSSTHPLLSYTVSGQYSRGRRLEWANTHLRCHRHLRHRWSHCFRRHRR